MDDDKFEVIPNDEETPENDAETEEADASPTARSADLGTNAYLRNMLDDNFLEYASYVIKDRAIPDVDDGLKPVQRRILWALHRIDDGKTHKVANVIGDTMKFHPHGDASIGDALVVLANKEYFITRQGNFGNIHTGHPAAAARYIECSLSDLGREVLFNDDITPLVDSYDSRNREPVVLPVKIPSLLLLGAYGIAVGMRTQIMPHNFNEVLRAQIARLRGEEYELYPDFLQGGIVDVSEYNDGNGKINLRARIEIDGRRLVIREIPATVTTESLIASVERAADKGKIKIASINDFTSEAVEIEIVPTRGYDPQKALRALYMYTDCSVSVSVNMMVICENRPREMNVRSVLERNTEKLLEYLKRELEIELGKLEDQFHARTLAQIFIENRVYKRIEECKTEEAVCREVHQGLAPFRSLVRRDITDEDVGRLLLIQIGRISRFSIEKNQKELRDILRRIDQVNRHLKHLTRYAVKYLEDLIARYGHLFPRRTEIRFGFEKIDRKATALNNIRIGYDRRNGYLGTAVKSDDVIVCNEFDLLLQVDRSGGYKVTDLPGDKLFVGKLYDCRRQDPGTEFGILYREVKSGKYYGKRSRISSFIKDREYQLCPSGCRMELLTPRPDAVYELNGGTGRAGRVIELNLMSLPARSPKARGQLIKVKNLRKITQLRYLSEEELLEFRNAAAEETSDDVSETAPEESVAGPETGLPAAPEPPTPEPAGPETLPPPTAPKREAPRKTRKTGEKPPPEKSPENPAEGGSGETRPKSRRSPAERKNPVGPPRAAVSPKAAPEVPPVSAAIPGTAPEVTVASETAPEPERRPAPVPARNRKPKPAPASGSDDDGDDLGIIQPEFGF